MLNPRSVARQAAAVGPARTVPEKGTWASAEPAMDRVYSAPFDRGNRLAARGRFRVRRAAVRDCWLLLNGEPSSHCFRTLDYNSMPLDGNTFSQKPYALEHKLELVIADQAATLTETVLKRIQR